MLYENKKILILGFAREGKSTLNFLNKNSKNCKIDIADIKNGVDYLKNLNDYDIVIKSPGIPNKLTQIKQAKSGGVLFTSQTEIFFDLVKGRVIGITGTKGKSTTASLIYNILKTAKKNVYLIGNLGLPPLDFIDKDSVDAIFVFELSSHQLSNLKKSPHIAVFLNIYPEHLDYYEDYNDYFNAKTNIAKFQNEDDFFIYNNNFEEIEKLAQKVKSKKNKIDDFEIKLKNNPLLGKHNLLNINASVAAAKCLKIDEKYIVEGIETFKPLVDRLELVRDINGIKFINDGLATIPEATISSIEAFEGENLTLILGGFDRGIGFSNLGKYISENHDVKNVILIGQTANRIEKTLKKFSGGIYSLGFSTMSEIVNKAYEIAKPKGIVLLSPSATSFDMFRDYKDRDDQFKKAVNSL